MSCVRPCAFYVQHVHSEPRSEMLEFWHRGLDVVLQRMCVSVQDAVLTFEFIKLNSE